MKPVTRVIVTAALILAVGAPIGMYAWHRAKDNQETRALAKSWGNDLTVSPIPDKERVKLAKVMRKYKIRDTELTVAQTADFIYRVTLEVNSRRFPKADGSPIVFDYDVTLWALANHLHLDRRDPWTASPDVGQNVLDILTEKFYLQNIPRIDRLIETDHVRARNPYIEINLEDARVRGLEVTKAVMGAACSTLITNPQLTEQILVIGDAIRAKQIG
jgi:hypothetical protein